MARIASARTVLKRARMEELVCAMVRAAAPVITLALPVRTRNAQRLATTISERSVVQPQQEPVSARMDIGAVTVRKSTARVNA